MKRTSNFKPHDVSGEQRSDGTLLLRSMPKWAMWLIPRLIGCIVGQTKRLNIFLAERSGQVGAKKPIYPLLQRCAIAASLLARGMGPDTHNPDHVGKWCRPWITDPCRAVCGGAHCANR